MKTTRHLIVTVEWVSTLLISYCLLQYGADRMSQLVAAKFIDGNFSRVDGWLSLLGFVALPLMFCLIHPRTRFYTAALLTLVLAGDSLKSLSLGQSQAMLVPLISLGSAMVVLLTRKPKPYLIQSNVANCPPGGLTEHRT